MTAIPPTPAGVLIAQMVSFRALFSMLFVVFVAEELGHFVVVQAHVGLHLVHVRIVEHQRDDEQQEEHYHGVFVRGHYKGSDQQNNQQGRVEDGADKAAVGYEFRFDALHLPDLWHSFAHCEEDVSYVGDGYDEPCRDEEMARVLVGGYLAEPNVFVEIMFDDGGDT